MPKAIEVYYLVVLLMADDKDPLFLQVMEARALVLEAYAGKSVVSRAERPETDRASRTVRACHLLTVVARPCV